MTPDPASAGAVTCTNCNGSGSLPDMSCCPICGGGGKVIRKRDPLKAGAAIALLKSLVIAWDSDQSAEFIPAVQEARKFLGLRLTADKAAKEAADFGDFQRLDVAEAALAGAAIAQEAEQHRSDEYWLAMAALDNYPIEDGLPKSTSVVYRIHQLGHAHDALLADRAAREAVIQQMADAAEMLWVVLANVSGGDWTQQSQDWQDAAVRWRDNYYAALTATSALSTPPEPRT